MLHDSWFRQWVFFCLAANNNNAATVFMVNPTRRFLLRSNIQGAFLMLVMARAHCDILFVDFHSCVVSAGFFLDVFHVSVVL